MLIRCLFSGGVSTNFVADCSVGACNMKLHIHVVVNWQMSKQGMR